MKSAYTKTSENGKATLAVEARKRQQISISNKQKRENQIRNKVNKFRKFNKSYLFCRHCCCFAFPSLSPFHFICACVCVFFAFVMCSSFCIRISPRFLFNRKRDSILMYLFHRSTMYSWQNHVRLMARADIIRCGGRRFKTRIRRIILDENSISESFFSVVYLFRLGCLLVSLLCMNIE